ncbi:MAG: RND transporter [Rhodothermales bacterium]
MRWLDRIPLWLLAVGAVFMALAPFVPEPHLWRDLKWLIAGELTRPEDVFDLFWHAALPVLLVVRLVRAARREGPAN